MVNLAPLSDRPLTSRPMTPECRTPRRPQRPGFPRPRATATRRACIATTARFIRVQTTDEKGQNCGGPTRSRRQGKGPIPLPPVAALVPLCASPVDAAGHRELWVAPRLCQVRPSSHSSLKIRMFRCRTVIFCLQLVAGGDRLKV